MLVKADLERAVLMKEETVAKRAIFQGCLTGDLKTPATLGGERATRKIQ